MARTKRPLSVEEIRKNPASSAAAALREARARLAHAGRAVKDAEVDLENDLRLLWPKLVDRWEKAGPDKTECVRELIFQQDYGHMSCEDVVSFLKGRMMKP